MITPPTVRPPAVAPSGTAYDFRAEEPLAGVGVPKLGTVGVVNPGIGVAVELVPPHEHLDMSASTLQSLGNAHALVMLIRLGLTVANNSQ